MHVHLIKYFTPEQSLTWTGIEIGYIKCLGLLWKMRDQNEYYWYPMNFLISKMAGKHKKPAGRYALCIERMLLWNMSARVVFKILITKFFSSCSGWPTEINSDKWKLVDTSLLYDQDNCRYTPNTNSNFENPPPLTWLY